jgi:hypothetical protein
MTKSAAKAGSAEPGSHAMSWDTLTHQLVATPTSRGEEARPQSRYQGPVHTWHKLLSVYYFLCIDSYATVRETVGSDSSRTRYLLRSNFYSRFGLQVGSPRGIFENDVMALFWGLIAYLVSSSTLYPLHEAVALGANIGGSI